MNAKYLAIIIASMILFSASVPVYASHVKIKEPTENEKRLFEKILARLDEHFSMMNKETGDVEHSFSSPLKIFFSCRTLANKEVESVSISVKTQLSSFDQTLAAQHPTGLLGGMYVWDCTAVKDRYTLTIECVNTLMLNPDFLVKEETETEEKKIVAMAENEMVLYHELLHGELMIDAMQDSNDKAGWRKDACTFFANNNNEIDYEPSDGDHKIISPLELDYLAKLVDQQGGKLIIKTIDNEKVGSREFTEVVATFNELGAIAKIGFFVFARAINMPSAELIVSTEEKTVSVKGYLEDASSDGTVRLFVLPRTEAANVLLDLQVDNALKSNDSEFVFNVKVENLQGNDVSGIMRLQIDGQVVATKEIHIQVNGIEHMNFVWKSNDIKASKHTAKIDGFNNASNEVTFFTYDRFESNTVNDNNIVTDQVFVDPETNEGISIAKPNRISATIIMKNDAQVQLIAPDGTVVIGKNALVSYTGSKAHIVKVLGASLVVKYTQLNERLQFFAVKPTVNDIALPSGEWSIGAIDSEDNDTRIKYYVNYIGNASLNQI
jgi:hypothetical protein